MIDPFTIDSTRIEPDGSTGVLYTVKYREQTSPTTMVTKTMQGYFNVPADQDVKRALFEHLKQAGWIT